MKKFKIQNRLSSTYLLTAVCCGLCFLTLSSKTADAQSVNPAAAVESRAQTWATETGKVAGGAEFCKIDPELLESYITRAQARIAAEAFDEVELVVARITFSNTMNTSSVSEPVEGCENFNHTFERESLRLD